MAQHDGLGDFDERAGRFKASCLLDEPLSSEEPSGQPVVFSGSSS